MALAIPTFVVPLFPAELWFSRVYSFTGHDRKSALEPFKVLGAFEKLCYSGTARQKHPFQATRFPKDKGI
jgi:hypothetical protein